MRAKLDRDIFVLPRCLQPAIGPIPTNGAAQQSLSAENGQRTVLFPVNCELDTMRTLMTATTLSTSQYQQARLARDARFDGLFFVAVKTTGIFCRPICPANAPKEANVEYFANAALAANAGIPDRDGRPREERRKVLRGREVVAAMVARRACRPFVETGSRSFHAAS